MNRMTSDLERHCWIGAIHHVDGLFTTFLSRRSKGATALGRDVQPVPDGGLRNLNNTNVEIMP
ncbi:MAG: hypothetical protein AAGK37_01745 [Pseudomonadota bacterium]